MTLFNRLLKALKIAFVEDKCRPDLASMWLKGGTPDVRKTDTLFGRKTVKENPIEWLDIWLDGRMVEINGKGRIRAKRCKHKNTWFDRTISYDSTGHEYGMGTYCSDCGKKLN